MKLKKPFFASALAVLCLTVAPGCSRSNYPAKNSQEDTIPAVKNALRDQAFKVRITQMYPQYRRSIPITTYFSLELRNDSVFSDLPYFGEAYVAQFPTDHGLVFEAPVKELKFTPGKKGETEVSFQARHNSDIFTYTVTLWKNGSTDIRVQAVQRQSISYHGELEENK